MPDHRAQVLDRAVAEGKFPASRRAHYERLWDADPEGTEAFVASLEPSIVAESGSATTAAPEGDGSYVETHLTAAERGRIAAARAGQQHSRIVSEPS